MRISLVFVLALVAIGLAPELVLAAEEGASLGGLGLGAGIGAGAAIGFGALGCGIGQGMATAQAVAGIARNPGAAGQIQTPLILGLALIESIALYGFVIAFMLQGKI